MTTFARSAALSALHQRVIAAPNGLVALAVCLMAAYVIGVLPSIGQPLLETHAHRQTQTAYTAVLYAERGIDLFRPPLPVLGPPGYLPQEFPIVQALGALIIEIGVPADMAMRLTGLGSFLICASFVFLLARRLVGGLSALVALAAFIFNPLAWVYGRSSTIEYLAAGGGVAFLYFAIRWQDDQRLGNWIGALVAAAMAVLVKITTSGFYLIPALFWRSRDGRWGFQRAPVWALVAITVLVGVTWSAHAEAVREESPAAAFLSMRNQLAWFFGSLATRFDPGSWRVPLVALLALSGFALPFWVLLASRWARHRRHTPFLFTTFSLAAVMPLILFNLYAVHDYYWIAAAPVIALIVGAGAASLLARWRNRLAPRAAGALLAAWLATVVGMHASWTIIYGVPGEQARAEAIAGFIAAHSDPQDWVVLRGWGWNTTFFYYARRQGIAVPEPRTLDSGLVGGQDLSEVDLQSILSDPILGPFIVCDHEGSCDVQASEAPDG
jgi:hypothetical protein